MKHSSSTPATVLVTGGTGFLGAYIIGELVRAGYAVRAIRRGSTVPGFIPPAIWEKVEWITGDVLDIAGLEEAMEGAQAVVHAAGKVSFSARDRHELFSTNVDGTANVVNTALSLSIGRFVHVSSVAALGRAGKGEHITEDRTWQDSRYNTTYAISKFRGEMEVWRGIGEGLPAVVVNPSTILGYGDWNSTSCTLFRSAYHEFPWYTEGINGFVDVADTAKAVVRLLESDIVGERYILNGDNWTFRRLFESIAGGFGKRPPTREATPFLSGIAWRVERLKSLFSGRPSLLTRESARVAGSSTWFDNSKVLRHLPDLTFTPLEVTIRDACQAYMRSMA